MAYGTIKVDNITFDNGGVDKLITVSGLFYSTSGALTVTGTISGGSVTAPTATFTTLTGTTTAGTTATFTSGSFTSLTGVTTTVTSGVFGLGSAAAPSIAFSGDPNTGIYSPGADQVGISTGGTGRVFVDGSGKVGIGTSATTKLDVAGSGDSELRLQAASDAALIFSETTANKNWKIKPSAGDFYLQYSATAYNSGYSSLVTLTSSGNVGIGVSSPQHPVHIDGTSGAVQFRAGVTYAGTGLDIKATENSDVTIDVNDSTKTVARALVFSQAGSERMRIDSSGNVGIGVVPSNWNQGTNIDIGAASCIGNNSNLTQISNNRVLTSGANYYKITAAASLYSTGAGQHIWYTAPSGTAGAAISFTQAMTLDVSGRLGIGITSPSVPLQVLNAGTGNNTNNGAITLCRTGTVGSTLYHMYSTAASDEAFAFSVHGGTTFSDTTYTKYLASAGGVHIWYGTTTSAERMRIDSSGNVGIGVTPSAWGTGYKVLQTPSASFSSFNTATFILWQNGYYDGTSTKYVNTGYASNYQQVNGQHVWNTAPSGTAGAAISFTQAMTLDASGRLGIGTTTPQDFLSVYPGITGGISLLDSGNTVRSRFFVDHTGGVNSTGIRTQNYWLDLDASGSSQNAIRFFTGIGNIGTGSERARIDSSGRLLVGTSSDNQWTTLLLQGNSNSTSDSAQLRLCRGTTTPAATDTLGAISFSDSSHVGAAIIQSTRDGGTWTSGTSQPTALLFSTTASGSASPTERYRITNDGVMCHDQPTPATYAAAATLTVADLKTGIITYTGGAATLTLPTGTLTEGGFAGIYTNMTFEWSVINTGAGICTIGAGTAHTIVGSGSVAIGASARFTSRRTAANTFVSYRLS